MNDDILEIIIDVFIEGNFLPNAVDQKKFIHACKKEPRLKEYVFTLKDLAGGTNFRFAGLMMQAAFKHDLEKGKCINRNWETVSKFKKPYSCASRNEIKNNFKQLETKIKNYGIHIDLPFKKEDRAKVKAIKEIELEKFRRKHYGNNMGWIIGGGLISIGVILALTPLILIFYYSFFHSPPTFTEYSCSNPNDYLSDIIPGIRDPYQTLCSEKEVTYWFMSLIKFFILSAIYIGIAYFVLNVIEKNN